MPSFVAEKQFQRQGLILVTGLDEVGRGAWAGPLVAGAVILPVATRALRRALAMVNDSKQLRPAQREECASVIRAQAIATAIGIVNVLELDALGIVKATRAAMRRAIVALNMQPQALLIDAFPLPDCNLPQRAIIRGDSHSFSIAAASIIAKVERDAMLCQLHAQYPQYQWASNKGYGTAAHQKALREFGPSPEHRRSFAPVSQLVWLDGQWVR
jgi:ribonuclease HII